MKISAGLAQDIVKSSMAIIERKINIIDENGIILASGDQSRVNTYHEPSADVIKTGKIIEIDKVQSSQIDGVLPGISLPITFNERIVGVVGITGDPEDVRVYGKLLKSSVELMLRDSFLMHQLQVEAGARDRFIHDLLKGKFEDDLDLFSLRAQTLGYNINVPRIAMVIDIVEIDHTPLQEWLRCEAGRELKLESLASDIQRKLRRTQEKRNMVTRVGRDRFVLLRLVDQDIKEEESRNTLQETAQELRKTLAKVFNVIVSIGIGNMAYTLEEYSRSYRDACLVLKIIKGLTGKPGIYYWDAMGINIILEYIPEDVVASFAKATQVLDDDLKETAKVFFDYNLNINQAAKELFVHRNTMTYRLDRVKNLTGLDPRNFNEAMYLYLAIMLEKYNS